MNTRQPLTLTYVMKKCTHIVFTCKLEARGTVDSTPPPKLAKTQVRIFGHSPLSHPIGSPTRALCDFPQFLQVNASLPYNRPPPKSHSFQLIIPHQHSTTDRVQKADNLVPTTSTVLMLHFPKLRPHPPPLAVGYRRGVGG
jgi:hypothetical protein